MKGQKTKSTDPELRLRRALFAAGLRYRIALKVPGLPRRSIDVAFPRHKLAVFVDGCFWHRCPAHYVPPTNNAAWWDEKTLGNSRRDDETTTALEQAGWTVLRLWEHESTEHMVFRTRVALGLDSDYISDI